MNNIAPIGLVIAGTKTRGGGFAPLVSVGVSPKDEFSNMDRVPLISEKPVYIIKHTQNYILYQIIDRMVKPCDRDTLGVLVVSMTINKDVQLADNKSPYSLLKETYDAFVANYMECGTDGIDKFKDSEINQDIFKKIVNKYPLETQIRKRYFIMNSASQIAGVICVPVEKMNDLFRDSQYREFEKFKEIEVGQNCQTTAGLENLDIPRPIPYRVVVNDKYCGELATRSEIFDTARYFKNTENTKYNNFKFSINMLLSSHEQKIDFDGDSYAQLDETNRCVNCHVHSEEIKYRVIYQLSGGNTDERNDILKYLLENKISITKKGQVLDFSTTHPTYIPASCVYENVSISLNKIQIGKRNLNLDVQQRIDDRVRQVVIAIRITYQQSPQPSLMPIPQQGKREKNERLQANKINFNEAPKQQNGKKKMPMRLVFGIVGFLLGIFIGISVMLPTYIHTRDEKESLRADNTRLKNILSVVATNVQDAGTSSMTDDHEAEEKAKEVERKAKEAEEKAKEVERKAKEAEEKAKEAKEKAKEAKEKYRAQILDLVNKKNLAGCRSHQGWKGNALTYKEKCAVEAILDLDKYKGVAKQQIKGYLKNITFNNWDEIVDAQYDIIKIQVNSK